MKKVIVFLILAPFFFILLPIHLEQIRLKAKRDEYIKSISKTRRENYELKKRMEMLKKADYDTIKEQATRLGFIKNGEKIIRFYKRN